MNDAFDWWFGGRAPRFSTRSTPSTWLVEVPPDLPDRLEDMVHTVNVTLR